VQSRRLVHGAGRHFVLVVQLERRCAMRFWLVFAAALALAGAAPAVAQQSTGKMPVPPTYSGPPPSIDGPQVLPPTSGTWLDPADLGITEVQTFAQVGLPAPIKEWPMLITAGFDLTNIKGPTVTDLPPRLYLAYVDFMWLPQIVKGYTALLSVVPSVFGDFTA